MNHKALLQITAEFLFAFRMGSGPADRMLAAAFREKRFLGSNDKRFVSETFYHTLRHLRRIDEAILSAFAGTSAADKRFSAGFPITLDECARLWYRDYAPQRGLRQQFADRLIDTLRLGLSALELKLDEPLTVAEEVVRAWPHESEARTAPVKVESIERMVARAAEVMALYTESRKPIHAERTYSWPSWLWAQLAAGRDIDELQALGAALNGQGPVAVRVNTLKAMPGQVQAAFADAGVDYRPGDLLPGALVLSSRVSRANLPGIREGLVETQDEGSQLVGVYTGVQPGQTVIDACAGGGGKALHLAALMQDDGRLYAMDRDPDRMEPLEVRAARAGATIVDRTLRYTRDGAPSPGTPMADVVLIDAPCTGTGTVRRNPESKWRLSGTLLEETRDAQRALLNQWAAFIKPGGALVYATCSLLAVENEVQVDEFLRDHPEFRIEPPAGFRGPLTSRGELRLQPHKHGCDGFYAARLVNGR